MTFEEKNTIKILASSNLHLGFAEREQLRSSDSVDTLNEILDIAKSEAVDFVLIAGDLFNESRPSRWAQHSCLDLLRKHCWGSAPVQIDCLNDWTKASQEGATSLHEPNFLDPDINIELPVFVINGFSDDPSGLGNLSELDTLDRAGIVDFYGKATSTEVLHIQPLLLQKGETLLCLYMLGAIRGELLKRLNDERKVIFIRPLEHHASWFNLFALHQAKEHLASKFNNSGFLQPWMDLVVNGHEHECIGGTTQLPGGGQMLQPGSTIRTSFSLEEVRPKHVFVLEICGKESRVREIDLKTVRSLVLDRFIWDETMFSSSDNDDDEFLDMLKTTLQKVIKSAENARRINPQLPWPPVVQLTVDVTGDRPVNPIKLGQQFADKVANPKSLFKIVTRRAPLPASQVVHNVGRTQPNNDVIPATIEDLVLQNFSDQAYEMLSAKVMVEAMKLFTEKDDNIAIQDAYEWQKKKTIDRLALLENVDPEKLTNEIALYRQEREDDAEDQTFLVHHTSRLAQPVIRRGPSGRGRGRVSQRGSKRGNLSSRPTQSDGEEDQNTAEVDSDSAGVADQASITRGARGRGRARGRGTAATRGRKGAPAASVSEEDSEEAADVESPEGSPVVSTRGTSSRPQRATRAPIMLHDDGSEESNSPPPRSSPRSSTTGRGRRRGRQE